MADDLTDAIEANALAPKKVQEGDTTVEQHPLQDQIAADRYIRSRNAVLNGGLGIYHKRLVPPGTADA